MSTPKLLRDVADILDRMGFSDYSIVRGKPHCYVVLRNGDRFRRVTLPGTPSDFRTIRNVQRDLRRAGLDIGINLYKREAGS